MFANCRITVQLQVGMAHQTAVDWLTCAPPGTHRCHRRDPGCPQKARQRPRSCRATTVDVAYAACSSINPMGRRYHAQTTVDVIHQNLRSGCVDPVPPASRGLARTRKKQVVAKLHCHCQQPSTSSNRMIECSNCWTWYHVACVSVSDASSAAERECRVLH